MTLEESREVIPMMETMINQIEEQQNLIAEMVQELQERDQQLLSFQNQNQSLKSLNSELSGLLNLLPDTEELLSQIEQQKIRIEQLENENQQWQELTQKQNSELLTLNEKLNSENRAENIEALRTRLKQTEERFTSETDSITTTLFTAILSPVFLNDCIVFFGALGKGIGSLFREFATGADSFGQLSSGIPNGIFSGIVYWLIAGAVMAILFVITGWLIIGIGYQVGKIYRKYCWDIISIVEVITSTAIAIYFGDWIKSVISINLITLLLLVHVVYIGIRCYVKDWLEERGYY